MDSANLNHGEMKQWQKVRQSSLNRFRKDFLKSFASGIEKAGSDNETDLVAGY
ncbi:MAG: hypothetical protein HN578_17750 [Rhodospirillales bacterium]|jgi:hypothetical protein|nr:hypothetical protein [Rhodospirillales bacterium]